MKVAVLGGTGFVGRYLIDELLSSGYLPKLLVRKSFSDNRNLEGVEIVLKDNLFDSLSDDFSDVDCVIYNIGIIREFPDQGVTFNQVHNKLAIHCMREAVNAGVERFILMSANDVDMQRTEYEITKLRAETYLKGLPLDWTIFRPSLIFGDPKGGMEFCTQLKRDLVLRPFPVPLFYNGLIPFNFGDFMLSPIHVKNVAEFFVKSIPLKESYGEIISLGGSTDIKWKKIVKMIADICEVKKLYIPTPTILVRFMAFMFDKYGWFPITRVQLEMLVDGNVCDSERVFHDYNITEISFINDNLQYLK